MKPPSRAERALARDEEDARLASLPVGERARALVGRFGAVNGPITGADAVQRLLVLGAAGVPALVAHLRHPETGWQAAYTLAFLGPPGAAAATDALRDVACDDVVRSATRWSLVALARLGCLDELAALGERPNKGVLVAGALTEMTPTSYPQLERCLDRGSGALVQAVLEALRPGRGRFFDPAPTSFEAALAGARSEHAALRCDAAMLLTLKTYPAATRARALPELARLAVDREAAVRGCAAVALGRLGRRAAPRALALVDALCEDPDEAVSAAARYARGRLARP
ncbi:MAG: hypothetical protein HY909_27455 [Deltaproteobacteria bacterium]|nr:hypothetical protein [Deltaproteobacteria bacterium]